MIPKGHAEAALQGSTKEGGRDMGVSGRETSGMPGPSTRDAAGVKVQAAMAREGSAKMTDTEKASILQDKDFCDGESLSE